MYSGTGVCVGHAHWQSTTLWKYFGSETSVGAVRPLLRAATSPACIPPDPQPSQPSLLLDRDALSQLPTWFQSCFSTGKQSAAMLQEASRSQVLQKQLIVRCGKAQACKMHGWAPAPGCCR